MYFRVGVDEDHDLKAHGAVRDVSHGLSLAELLNKNFQVKSSQNYSLTDMRGNRKYTTSESEL